MAGTLGVRQVAQGRLAVDDNLQAAPGVFAAGALLRCEDAAARGNAAYWLLAAA